MFGGNPGATAYRADVVDDVLKAGPSANQKHLVFEMIWQHGLLVFWH